MLTKVYLHGALGREFGREWTLDISSAVEAIQLIQANKPNFNNWIRSKLQSIEMLEVVVERWDGKFEKLNQDTFFMLRQVKSIRFIPKYFGSGRVGKAIAGVALIIIAAVCQCMSYGASSPGSFSMASLGWSMLGGAAAAVGGALILQALIGKQKSDDDEESYYFNGAVNNTEQGVAVPLIFGRCKVGSSVISSSIDVEDT
jgi:predicted phage tail protein